MKKTPIEVARQQYADHLGKGHLWYHRVLRGDCDTAPMLRKFLDDAQK